MKYLFVGDMHGKVKLLNFLQQFLGDYFIVFVGDLLDSYDQSHGNHLSLVSKVLDWCHQNKAAWVYGNHDAQYVLSVGKSSEWSLQMQTKIIPYADDMRKTCVQYVWIDNGPKNCPVLVTHAGMSRFWWGHNSADVMDVRRASTDLDSWYQVGDSRGGKGIGGPAWCDFPTEFFPMDNLNQVFGHSRGDTFRLVNYNGCDNWAIDCLDKRHMFLTLDNGVFNSVSL